jgi:toxin ParE1/3/4
MARRASRSPEARRDLVEIADYISGNSVDAAIRFLDAAEGTFTFLAANPLIGQLFVPANELIPPLRVWPIDGFRNHLVFYRPLTDGVEIVRVLHDARDLDSLLGK